MTKIEMMQELENARKFSERNSTTIVAMGNGQEIEWFHLDEKDAELMVEFDADGNVISRKTPREYFAKRGFWVVSIFQNGHRVEA